MDIFNNIPCLVIYDHRIFFHYFVSSSISFNNMYLVSVYRSFIPLDKFIPRYFSLNDKIINGIVFFNISASSLSAYRKCNKRLYIYFVMHLYHSCLLFLVVFVESLKFCFFFAIWMPFMSFSCLIVLAKTSSTILDKSDESGHPCLVPDLEG